MLVPTLAYLHLCYAIGIKISLLYYFNFITLFISNVIRERGVCDETMKSWRELTEFINSKLGAKAVKQKSEVQ